LGIDLVLAKYATKTKLTTKSFALRNTMQTIKFLLSQTNFFVYIKRKSIPGNAFCFGLGTNTPFYFVLGIKLFVLEMFSGVPP